MADGILIRPAAGEVLWWVDGVADSAHLTTVDDFLSQFRDAMGSGFRVSRRRAYLGCIHKTGAYLRVVPTAEDEGGVA